MNKFIILILILAILLVMYSKGYVPLSNTNINLNTKPKTIDKEIMTQKTFITVQETHFVYVIRNRDGSISLVIPEEPTVKNKTINVNYNNIVYYDPDNNEVKILDGSVQIKSDKIEYVDTIPTFVQEYEEGSTTTLTDKISEIQVYKYVIIHKGETVKIICPNGTTSVPVSVIPLKVTKMVPECKIFDGDTYYYIEK